MRLNLAASFLLYYYLSSPARALPQQARSRSPSPSLPFESDTAHIIDDVVASHSTILRRADAPPDAPRRLPILTVSFDRYTEPLQLMSTPLFNLQTDHRYRLVIESSVAVSAIQFYYDDYGRTSSTGYVPGPHLFPPAVPGAQQLPWNGRTTMTMVTPSVQQGGDDIQGYFVISFVDRLARGFLRVWETPRPPGPPAPGEFIAGGVDDDGDNDRF